MPFYYPEKKYQDWPRYLRNVVITVWVAVLVIFGIAVIARAVHVYDSHKEARQAATANDFWQQVAGTEPIADPSSRLGQLAQITRQLKAQPNPIRAFENYYIKPDSMGGVTGALGVKVAESHSGDITKQDEGAFTSDFILDALQANSDTVQDLMKPIPPVDDYGWASWQVLVGALVAIPGLGLLGWWITSWSLAWRYRHRVAKERKVALATLPNQYARDAYLLVESIKGAKVVNYALLREAEAFLEQCKRGLGGSTGSTDALTNQLAELQERWSFDQAGYRELTR